MHQSSRSISLSGSCEKSACGSEPPSKDERIIPSFSSCREEWQEVPKAQHMLMVASTSRASRRESRGNVGHGETILHGASPSRHCIRPQHNANAQVSIAAHLICGPSNSVSFTAITACPFFQKASDVLAEKEDNISPSLPPAIGVVSSETIAWSIAAPLDDTWNKRIC